MHICTEGGIEYRTFTFSCFLTLIWPETSGLRLPVCYQQSDNAKTHLQKEISLKNALFLSILSFQVEKKNHPFFHRIYILFLLENQKLYEHMSNHIVYL